jgi:hypothetical protein
MQTICLVQFFKANPMVPVSRLESRNLAKATRITKNSRLEFEKIAFFVKNNKICAKNMKNDCEYHGYNIDIISVHFRT